MTAPTRSDCYAIGSVESPLGEIGILCSELGLVSLSLPGETAERFATQVARFVGGREQRRDNGDPLVRQTADELSGYFTGTLREFSVPLDLRGTLFQRTVWEAVFAVPYGETVAYAEIARRIGRPDAPRAVGHANGSNPIPIIVACHRLVGSDGSLTGYGGGLEMKRALIEHERQFAQQA